MLIPECRRVDLASQLLLQNLANEPFDFLTI
jgi:hypothetical protein